MARLLSEPFIKKLKEGDLKTLFEFIKSDKELRLEIRHNQVYVYYKKGLALEIGSRNKLFVNPKYDNTPSPELSKENPTEYFEKIKKSINDWIENKKNRSEFETQQQIAIINQGLNDKYIIVDMEYSFEQDDIEKEKREKLIGIDLVGVEQTTGKIMFFEVKTGLGAIGNKSGIDEHIRDYNTYMFGKNCEKYKSKILKDVKSILECKTKLGLIQNTNLHKRISNDIPELIFVFEPKEDAEKNRFKAVLNNRKDLIIVSKNNYKLI